MQERPGPASLGPAGPSSEELKLSPVDPPDHRPVDTGSDLDRAGDPTPVGDNSTIRRLRDELGNDAAVDHFVTDFLALLDDRLSSLRGLISRRRVEDSVTALLTIETSSLMIGADELATAATRLRLVVSEQRAEPLTPLLAELDDAATQTKRDLSPA